MPHISPRLGFTLAAATLGAVVTIGALMPAKSGEDNRPLVQTFGSVTCNKPTPCETYSNKNSGPGALAKSNSGPGLSASSTNGDGADAISQKNGLSAATTNESVSTQRYESGVFGHDDSNDGGHINAGVSGLSTNGIGVFAQSANWMGANVQGGFAANNEFVAALSINGNGYNAALIHACAAGGANPCVYIQGGAIPALTAFQNGDLLITGHIYTAGSCSSGCAPTRGSGEKRVRMFTPQASEPTVEDFGEAQMIGGQAYVALDRAFANTIDKTERYMVFVTPGGDNAGLYVTAKTSAGFLVRESHNGRSTLSFDYRIVAKPYGVRAARLQMVTVTRPGMSLPPSQLP